VSPENDINPYQIENRSLAKDCLDGPHLYINFQYMEPPPPPSRNVHVAQNTARPRASSIESQILYFIPEKGHFIQHANFSNKCPLPHEENGKGVLFWPFAFK
jgi:hypothetical protein